MKAIIPPTRGQRTVGSLLLLDSNRPRLRQSIQVAEGQFCGYSNKFDESGERIKMVLLNKHKDRFLA